jgi:two-component system sensor histidine kinase VicK
LSKFEPPVADDRRRDFDESVSDARSVVEHLRATVRTVLDYDRFETGQLVPRHDRFLLAEAAVEILEELRRHAVMANKTVTLARPPVERALYGDRELLSAAMLNLGMAALRRIPTHGTLAIEIGETDVGMRFRMVAPGPPLQVTERIHAFEPYSRRAAGSATYGLGLALAQAVIGLHEGRIWVEELEGAKGCAFVFELGWQRSGPRPKRVFPTGPGEKSADRP